MIKLQHNWENIPGKSFIIYVMLMAINCFIIIEIPDNNLITLLCIMGIILTYPLHSKVRWPASHQRLAWDFLLYQYSKHACNFHISDMPVFERSGTVQRFRMPTPSVMDYYRSGVRRYQSQPSPVVWPGTLLKCGTRFNIKMSFQHGKCHCGDKTVIRSSYLHNGISYTGKTASYI